MHHMSTTIKSASLLGINAIEISVETDAHPGLPKEFIVGLPDTVIKESKNRIKSAIINSGFKYPAKIYTINLAPAEIQKEGPYFDVPIALGILHITKQLKADKNAMYVGELGLSGEIRPIRGVIAICQLALDLKYTKIIIPYDNYEEASLIKNIDIIPVKTLNEIYNYLNNRFIPQKPISKLKIKPKLNLDYEEVKGQITAKRAIEIAAAGNHNILFIGSPGSGKTMLLKRLPTILPELTLSEAIETIKLHSISTKSSSKSFLSLEKPFRSPHHSISYAGMAGGGTKPSPGEISLAHNGVLFLDELPEFSRQVLEVLRQPIEDNKIIISRANFSLEYPAKFLLAAAMNPCPCGYYRDLKVACICQKTQITKYWKKISGPIIDRIDIVLEIPRLLREDFSSKPETSNPYTSIKLRKRILNAREKQLLRTKTTRTNSELTPKEIKEFCQITSKPQKLLGKAIEKGWLTGRSYDKTLKVARTIADLENSESITLEHISESLQYRLNISS
jgi:magnesium chelatase family protein